MRDGAKLSERELEEIADKLLLAASADSSKGEFPYYKEEEIRRKANRDGVVMYSLAYQNSLITAGSMYDNTVVEARILLLELACVSGLTELERTILELVVAGMTQLEISASLAIPRRTLQRRIYKIRRKLQASITSDFWRRLHEVYVYRKPSMCCSPGMAECKTTGICPYHRTATP